MRQIEQLFILAAQQSQKKYGVPASVTLAQGILEASWLTRDLGANNFFGIKYSSAHHKGFVERTTREFSKERGYYMIIAKFAKFDSVQDCFEEHGRLISQNKAYHLAMANTDKPDIFARALQGVYATDPQYGNKLITIMKQQNLYQYDIIPNI